jgi:hypothetical protein
MNQLGPFGQLLTDLLQSETLQQEFVSNPDGVLAGRGLTGEQIQALKSARAAQVDAAMAGENPQLLADGPGVPGGHVRLRVLVNALQQLQRRTRA